MTDIRRLAPDDIDAVRPLWDALREHHGQVTPQMPPLRTPEDSWARRGARYREWLRGDSFALVAERETRLLGYALVHVDEGYDTWQADRTAQLETLSVHPDARGQGLGGALMDAVEAELRRRGIADLTVSVVTTNADAVRFYERRGLDRFLLTFHGRV